MSDYCTICDEETDNTYTETLTEPVGRTLTFPLCEDCESRGDE